MNTLIIILLFLIGYWKVKNQFAQRVRLKYKYRLYDLRDKLRDTAIKGKLDKNDWRFKYLDSSISKTVNELHNINLFTAIMLGKRYSHVEDFIMHKDKLLVGIKQDKYASFFHDEYGKLLVAYIFEKQFILMICINFYFKFHISFFRPNIRACNMLLKTFIGNIRFFPETSSTFDVLC